LKDNPDFRAVSTIKRDVDLKPYNTFGFSVHARHFAVLSTAEDVISLCGDTRRSGLPVLVLGGGSNVLFTKDVNALVAKVELGGIEQVRTEDNEVWVKAGAGVRWHDLVMHCVGLNLGGIENLSLIPGTVGAAPIQNIGAYGVELRDVLDSLEAVELSSGKVVTFSSDDCRFSYRDSVFKRQEKGKFVITSVTLRLTTSGHRFTTGYGALRKTLDEMGVHRPTLEAVSQAVIRIRSSKLPDPARVGNAGSFFKNPEVPADVAERLKSAHPGLPSYPGASHDRVKLPAGWLIEQCGWKGKSVGHVGVHSEQALVLVHHGGGTGSEIVALATRIKESVQERFGVVLEEEVNII
jgi:UDP-N-acetylmuramate dehydrogenase